MNLDFDACTRIARDGLHAEDRPVAKPAVAPPPPAPPPPPPPPSIKWVFHLKSGGRLKVVSFEEKGDSYVIKLPAGGTTTISKDAVEGIVKYTE